MSMLFVGYIIKPQFKMKVAFPCDAVIVSKMAERQYNRHQMLFLLVFNAKADEGVGIVDFISEKCFNPDPLRL